MEEKKQDSLTVRIMPPFDEDAVEKATQVIIEWLAARERAAGARAGEEAGE